MKREQIIDAFKMLAQSQGFYGRLLNEMRENEAAAEMFLTELEQQNFRDVVDLVMYVEGGV